MPVMPPRAILSPTNTGKTHEALERMLTFRSGMIGFPLRLLARENYDKLVKRLGTNQVALLTGEERIVPEGARYYCCTVESMPVGEPVEFIAVDEVQLAADFERGHVFTDRILRARGIKETLFLGAETIAPVLRRLVPNIFIETRQRFSELRYEGRLKLSRLPRRSAVVGFSLEDVYTNAEMIRRMRGGAAIVMGALSPRARNAQVELYQNGDVDFIVATDAIGMGLNMDIDHVSFSKVVKFDGKRHRRLKADELAQIAGRAGRYQKDGTFSTLPEVGGLEQDIITAIETHSFPPIEAVYWRSSHLDFVSPKSLLKSLQASPDNPILVPKRDAIDQLALEQMLKKKNILERAGDEETLRLLWQVCQIPDFRKTLNEAHFQLLSDVFLLLSDRGNLPDDWADQHIQRLDNTSGDIDALMTRIAHTRTWTYIAHRSDWFAKPEVWQQRSRYLEDKLSDALHQQLTHHFVDRRSSALVRKMAGDGILYTDVTKDGRVTVEGEFLGQIKGFRFRLHEEARSANSQVLMKVARKPLGQEVESRFRHFMAEKGKSLTLEDDGSIFWRREKIGYVVKGQTVYTPQVRILKSDLLEPRALFEIQKLVTDWLHEKIATQFRSLFDLKNSQINGYVKGFIYELFDVLGLRRTKDVREAISLLGKEEKAFLRDQGVHFGALATYLTGCTRQHQFELRMILARAYLELSPEIKLNSRAVILPNHKSLPKAFYHLCGYYLIKNQAIRLDHLEKLASKVHRGTRKGRYVLPAEEISQDISFETWRHILALMGYQKDRQETDTFVISKPASRKKPEAPATAKSTVDQNHPFAVLRSWGGSGA